MDKIKFGCSNSSFSNGLIILASFSSFFIDLFIKIQTTPIII